MISLSEIGKKYERAKRDIQQQKSSLREQIHQHIEAASIRSLKLQNYKVSEIHKNQKLIEEKLKRNAQIEVEVGRCMEKWTALYEGLNNALKNAGDLVNYSEYIESELTQVEKSMSSRQS